MKRSTSTTLYQDVTSSGGGRRYTPAEHARLEAFNVEIAKLEQRVFAIMAAAWPEQSEAIAEISWALATNKPVTIPEDAPKELHKLARLFRARRKVFPKLLPWRPATTARACAPVRRQPARPVAAPRERRDSSSSRTSGTDPGDDDPDDEGPGDGFELVLVDEETPATQTSPRYCRCDRDRPYARPNWDIAADGGHCRSCTHQLCESDVRRWHAIARDERARIERKGWLR